ncbi:hypothetical protein ABPG72_013073 [Tetrahymena utriculariae]
MSYNHSQIEDASPFNSPVLNKERSNSIQLPLGNGLPSIFLPISFSEDNINDLMNLAYKFELEEENEDLECENIEEINQHELNSNNSSQIDSVICN